MAKKEKPAEKISKDMMIMEALQKYPAAAEVLLNQGVHCLGCIASHGESLEQGLKAHGKSDKEIASIINEMNDIADKPSAKE